MGNNREVPEKKKHGLARGKEISSSLSGNSELGRLATDFLADETDGRSLKTLAYPFHLVSSVAHRFTPTGS
jgi:hypothetical protein